MSTHTTFSLLNTRRAGEDREAESTNAREVKLSCSTLRHAYPAKLQPQNLQAAFPWEGRGRFYDHTPWWPSFHPATLPTSSHHSLLFIKFSLQVVWQSPTLNHLLPYTLAVRSHPLLGFKTRMPATPQNISLTMLPHLRVQLGFPTWLSKTCSTQNAKIVSLKRIWNCPCLCPHCRRETKPRGVYCSPQFVFLLSTWNGNRTQMSWLLFLLSPLFNLTYALIPMMIYASERHWARHCGENIDGIDASSCLWSSIENKYVL